MNAITRTATRLKDPRGECTDGLTEMLVYKLVYTEVLSFSRRRDSDGCLLISVDFQLMYKEERVTVVLYYRVELDTEEILLVDQIAADREPSMQARVQAIQTVLRAAGVNEIRRFNKSLDR